MGFPYVCVYMFVYITVCLSQERKDSSCTHGLASSSFTKKHLLNEWQSLFIFKTKKKNVILEFYIFSRVEHLFIFMMQFKTLQL